MPMDEVSSIQKLVDELRREIDGTLIDARLLLTPTERIEKMREVLQFVEDLRSARANSIQANR